MTPVSSCTVSIVTGVRRGLVTSVMSRRPPVVEPQYSPPPGCHSKILRLYCNLFINTYINRKSEKFGPTKNRDNDVLFGTVLNHQISVLTESTKTPDWVVETTGTTRASAPT